MDVGVLCVKHCTGGAAPQPHHQQLTPRVPSCLAWLSCGPLSQSERLPQKRNVTLAQGERFSLAFEFQNPRLLKRGKDLATTGKCETKHFKEM